MGAIAAIVMFIALCAAPAAAQRGAFGLGQDLRLEGVVDPSAATKAQALGTIKIRAGKTVRKFAVFRAQTARSEGMSLFNRSSLHPEQLLLRGDKATLGAFHSAAANTRLNMLGRYVGDDYIVSSITAAAGSATPAATGPPQ